jgi:hypothetical protein
MYAPVLHASHEQQGNKQSVPYGNKFENLRDPDSDKLRKLE